MRECAACGKPFEPAYSSMQRVCGPRCAARLVKQRKRAEVMADTAARLRLKPRAQWVREVQGVFNAWVRERDAALPCISCGRMHQGQWHAGHYLSTGARPELRFNPDNCHRQCQPCNTHLHGNLVLYRVSLIERIGLERVEWLEGPHAAQKYTIGELIEMKAKYSAMARELRKGQA